MSSLWSESLRTCTKGHQSQISRQDSHPSAQPTRVEISGNDMGRDNSTSRTQKACCIWLNRIWANLWKTGPKVALPYTRLWVSAGIVLAKRLFQFEARGVPTTAGISPLRSLNSCLKVATHSRPCPLNNIQYQHIRTEYML